MLDLLILITLFAFAIPSIRLARTTRAHLAHMERRMERLEAMHCDVLLKLGHAPEDVRAAYPKMPRFDEPVGREPARHAAESGIASGR